MSWFNRLSDTQRVIGFLTGIIAFLVLMYGLLYDTSSRAVEAKAEALQKDFLTKNEFSTHVTIQDTLWNRILQDMSDIKIDSKLMKEAITNISIDVAIIKSVVSNTNEGNTSTLTDRGK